METVFAASLNGIGFVLGTSIALIGVVTGLLLVSAAIRNLQNK